MSNVKMSRYPENYYLVEGVLIRTVEALMERLYSENRMSGDEMRDWGNKLHAMLESRVQSLTLSLLDELSRMFP